MDVSTYLLDVVRYPAYPKMSQRRLNLGLKDVLDCSEVEVGTTFFFLPEDTLIRPPSKRLRNPQDFF